MPIYRKKKDRFFQRWGIEMAYVLGYFAADGNMIKTKRKNYYISFTSTDRELIKTVRYALLSNLKITSRTNLAKVYWKRLYVIQIGSKKMFEDLLLLGFCPNKSKILKMPKVPQKYFRHFVRGYFDGDGHVSSGIYLRSSPRKNPYIKIIISGFTCGSKAFLKSLRRGLKTNAFLGDGTFYYSKRAYRLSYSINDSKKLYKFMYTGIPKGLYLRRKRKIFEKFFSNRGPVV